MALSACLSSSVKAATGTSSHTGSTATVDRLLVGLVGSELEAMPKPEPTCRRRGGGHPPRTALTTATGPGQGTLLSPSRRGPTGKGPAELLKVSQDLLAQEVDEAGDNLQGRGQGQPSNLMGLPRLETREQPGLVAQTSFWVPPPSPIPGDIAEGRPCSRSTPLPPRL